MYLLTCARVCVSVCNMLICMYEYLYTHKCLYSRVHNRKLSENIFIDFVGIEGGTVLPNASDICAGFQYSVLCHLARRVQRGILYCHAKGWIPHSSNCSLVSSSAGLVT